MQFLRTLTVGISILAAVTACTPAGTATTAPTGAGATTAPVATAGGSASPAATTAATMAPATDAPATTAPATSAPASAPPAGGTTAAFAVFEPEAGSSTMVQGGATLFGAAGQTLVVIGVMSSSTESMAASIQAGTCDNRAPEIVHRLTDVASGASSTTVAVDLATLLSTPHVVNISVLGSETESSITCGDIRPLTIQ